MQVFASTGLLKMLCNSICQLISEKSTGASPAEQACEKHNQNDFLPPVRRRLYESTEPKTRRSSEEAAAIGCGVNQQNVGRGSPRFRGCKSQKSKENAYGDCPGGAQVQQKNRPRHGGIVARCEGDCRGKDFRQRTVWRQITYSPVGGTSPGKFSDDGRSSSQRLPSRQSRPCANQQRISAVSRYGRVLRNGC
jgi:hypothetical protein